MIPKTKQQGWRLGAAAGGVAAAVFLSGCGKPVSVKSVIPDNSVKRETGELPSAGRASRLLSEQSAFLRRHANDPIEWHPWGAEAFDKAKKENRLLLVSIGYASCPWSQKMHHDSFVDPEIARFMNKHFVCVLVDREERPDINTTFLHYAFWKQQLSGWPLHIWLTPDGLPVYQGIYFPKEAAGSQPSWRLTLEHVANNWESGPEYVKDQAKKAADSYLEGFRRRWNGPPPEGIPDSKEAKAFMALSPAERLKKYEILPDTQLQLSVSDLSGATLEELWSQLAPATAASFVGRLQPVYAAALQTKIKNPRVREQAFQRFISESRNLCFTKLRSVFDGSYGGFGGAPRFAPHQSLDFLYRYGLRAHQEQAGRPDPLSRVENTSEMIAVTLDNLLAGGLVDQLGGGFHRYSTDIYWAVPQFEKMIYDQGFMARALSQAYQFTGKQDYLKAAKEALGYATRELSHPEGGFYCAEGSSSPAKDGEMTEGAYYLWSEEEIAAVAGPDAPLVAEVFGIEKRGNLPMDSSMRKRLGNTNVLSLKKTPEEAGRDLGLTPADARAKFEEARAKLLKARGLRQRPTLEDKVLTSWSGLAISGYAITGWAAGDASLTARGEKAAEFILAKLRSSDGGLLHAFLDGPSPLPGYSEDYATFINSLCDLYEATGTVRWLQTALELQERQIKDLWDKKEGGFFDGPDSPLLFHRMKSMDESSEIAPGSTSLLNLVKLSQALNITDYRDKARRIAERYGPHAAVMPGAFFRFLRAVEFLADPPYQVVISGDPADPACKALIDALRPVCLPGSPVLYMDGGESQKFLLEKVPALAPLNAVSGKPAVHFCHDFKPEKSFTNPAEMKTWAAARYLVPAASGSSKVASP